MTTTVSDGLETIACPNCARDGAALWASENGFNAVKCAGCGLVYVNPRPRAEIISEANRVGVHGTGSGDLQVVFRRHPSKIRRLSKIVGGLFPELSGAERAVSWLDVGAGYGELLEALRPLLPPGSAASGIEPMQAKAEEAQRHGLAVESKLLSEIGGNFDVVSLMNVFSHIPDFPEFGAMVVEKIRPGGSLLVQTGNGGDLASRKDYPGYLYLPDHLVFAGVEHVTKMVTGLGMKLEAVEKIQVDDTIVCAKILVRSLMRGRLRLPIPYTSPFRSVFYRFRKAA
jgi:2-polyprenyl-3-methyl-5-hydroxy-6-metoxy-1,4-benzoquinol methylase